MEIKVNSKGEKLYPFSMRRYGHNIEYAYNTLYCNYSDMLDGKSEWNDKVYESWSNIQEVYAKAMGNAIYWATGKEYGMLKSWSMWAECRRDQIIAERAG